MQMQPALQVKMARARTKRRLCCYLVLGNLLLSMLKGVKYE